MVTTDSRSKRPLVRTMKVRDWPDGMGPPAPVNTVRTPGSCGRADSRTLLSASSAIAATPWLASSPTRQTWALLLWRTNSGGDSGWEPGAPGPGGVRLVTVTFQVVLPPADAGAARPSTRSRRIDASFDQGEWRDEASWPALPPADAVLTRW